MILAIDQGTTGTTCLVFDLEGTVLARASREFTQHFPRPGWVEHDASEIWQVVHAVAGEALASAGVRRGELEAVGITNQRESVLAWDPATGEPITSVLVWQDRRTAERCKELRTAGHEQLVRERTGLVLDPYFSATKIEWLLHEVDGLRARAADGRALFGTIDAWLIWQLCGEHACDPSNASRTLLYDINRGCWDEELLELFGSIPQCSLPRVLPSAGEFGRTLPERLHGHTVPVCGVAGDQQASLFGQGCISPGLGKNTYGTGSFVLINAGTAMPRPSEGLLTTIAWSIGERVDYALEAAIFVTGAAVQWLRDGLGVIQQAEECEQLARGVAGNGGVYFVPALTGLGSPHWDPNARGAIHGLTRGTTRAHIARAALEAIAYQTVDAVRAMEAAGAPVLAELRADGGASVNSWLMQFQADLLGVPVLVADVVESTALGAAQLAAVGAGLSTLEHPLGGARCGASGLGGGQPGDSSSQHVPVRARYEPQMSEQERASLLGGWHEALARVIFHPNT